MRFVQTIVTATFLITIVPSAFAAHPLKTFKPEAVACRDRARDAMDLFEGLAGRHAHHAAYMRGDLAPMKAAYTAAAEAWRIAADAFDEGDETAPQLRTAAEETGRACAIWRDRLESREKQGVVAATEAHYNSLNGGAGPAAREALGNLTEARRSAADAWGLVAEATVPGADSQVLAILREKALQAAAEVEVAAVIFNATDRRERLKRKSDSTSPQLQAALEELKRLDDERAALQREDIALAAQLRAIDRKRDALEEQVRQSSDAAKNSAGKK